MSGEKTEQPTPQRLRRLRREGDVPFSGTLSSTVALVAAVAAALLCWPSAVRHFAACFGLALEGARTSDVATAGVVRPLLGFGVGVSLAAAPVVIAAAAGGVMGSVAQTGMLFVPKRLVPDMQRFKPFSAWKQRLKKEVIIQGIFALIFASLGLFAGHRTLLRMVELTPEVLRRSSGASTDLSPVHTLSAYGTPLFRLLMVWLALAVVAGVIDRVWRQRAFTSRNMMSLKEIRDEHKSSEGDPEIKAKRKALHRELLTSSPARAITESAVVIRNPTHVVVGLKYVPDEVDAPVVTIAAKGESARDLLRRARRAGVPEVTDPPVARALLRVPIGEPIPHELYPDIAVIFRWLDTSGADPTQ